ncbi:bicyclomycin resistance protein [Ideonella sp. 4Y16]|uniref:Bicyclomycin resistance protein n=1 Tax=Ideonella alba TaxID=2824118 RepID=A0A940Y8C8_9BURK|nr:ABC transporter substrate-binding protein [Ideonella alba]MBQ0929558.1 bicyclomycin resistance protein [Ideonella alba]MBQ0944660.1 bicyclomycin resistance protein [Ideonella alba]
MLRLLALFPLVLLAALAGPARAAEPARVLHYAFPIAETGFDPAQVSDLYSRTVVANIVESPLTYDFLARPARLKPQTAEALPVPSDNFRTWTLRIRPGIYFADDPAFKGQRRELVAQDYVYTIKRLYDPALKSPVVSQLENARLLGLSELKRQALKDKTPFPYDQEVEGVRALDRYTLQFRLAAPAPRFAYVLADGAMLGAVAREVVEHYGDQIMAHPVGTGPFRLAAWKRSSKIVLERNPGFREQHYDEQASPGDAEGEAMARRLAGRRLPMLDRVEISIVEESQPRLLGFLNAEHDFLDRLPPELSPMAAPGGQLAPHLAKKGVQLQRMLGADIGYSYFGMENPVVGGYAPAQVALRRAIALAYDTQAENVQVRKGQAVAAQSIVPPHTTSYDPAFKSEMSDQDLARAQALLDLHGWIDRNGDGWRDRPDGQPLTIEYATQPDQASRVLTEIWQRAFDALRIRVQFKPAKWPENLKASRAGKLMMWGVAWSATTPDASYMLDLMYGPSKGQANHARFNLPEVNQLFERQAVLPDGPERQALIDRIKRLGVAYMPYKINHHRLHTDLLQPWVDGYRRHPFMREFWRYLDVDPARQAARH